MIHYVLLKFDHAHQGGCRSCKEDRQYRQENGFQVMHELGICDALLKMVRGIAKDEELEEISRITVEVGSLSGVVPAYMSDCWIAVTDGTELQDVEFVVEELKGTARCMDCDEEFEADFEHLRCPKCRGDKLIPLTGRDLTLKEILAP